MAERGDVDPLSVGSQALFPERDPAARPDEGHRWCLGFTLQQRDPGQAQQGEKTAASGACSYTPCGPMCPLCHVAVPCPHIL